MSTSYIVRPATVQDVPAILDFIKQLALYEKEPDSVKATEDTVGHPLPSQHPHQLRLNVFEKQYAHVLIAEEQADGNKMLFRALGEVAKEKECGRMDWSVLTWNEPSIAFYTKVLGASPMDGWQGMRLEKDGIERLATLLG